MRLRCPECGSRAGTRTSRPVSLTVTEAYFDCANPECGCRFKVLAEIVGVIVQGEMPKPLLSLPVIKRRLQTEQ